jgi:hypothetical protein
MVATPIRARSGWINGISAMPMRYNGS